MFLILPKTLLKFISWPKFDEGCWNWHMILFKKMIGLTMRSVTRNRFPIKNL